MKYCHIACVIHNIHHIKLYLHFIPEQDVMFVSTPHSGGNWNKKLTTQPLQGENESSPSYKVIKAHQRLRGKTQF